MVTLRVRSMVWFSTGVVLAVLATVLVMQTWRVDAAPGDKDSTFVPVTPCRLFDMRPGEEPNGGKKLPLAAGEGNVHVQQVTGNVGNCVGIPADATAVSMNVTIVSPTAQSNLRVYPADVATPTVSNLNWLPGQSPTPNKVDVKLSDDGRIKLYNHAGTVNVLADVVGYYTNATLKELAATAGAPGPSTDLATVGQFTTTQIVKDAILTCGTVTDSGLGCGTPRLNTFRVSANGGGVSQICLTIFGTEPSVVDADDAGPNPVFAWSGSNWLIDTPPAIQIISFSCDPMVP
jgi:hypothetical protein